PDVGRQAELLPADADGALDGVARGMTDPRAALGRVLEWSHQSTSGDLAELAELGEEHPLRGRLASTRDSCSGRDCSEYARCHVFAARRAAMEADIVVVNHHLLLADLALKEEGFGDLLPSVDAVILDEAHQLPDLASEFFGVSLSARQIELLLQDLARAPATRSLGAPLSRALQLAQLALGRHERPRAWRDLSAAAREQLGTLQ